MLSIIIPSLNEEKYLPLLLESIKKQSFDAAQDKDYEIILADAGSTDKTLEIAKQYGCVITGGGLPPKGRNEGAKIAKGDLLVFIDSDVILQNGFLGKALKEFGERKLDIASFCIGPVPVTRQATFMLDIFYNFYILALENILPHAAMVIFVKKDFFEKVKGFDESITLAEDMDFARRVKKLAGGKFGIIRSVKVFASDRRFRADGWWSVGVKSFLAELHMIFLGPIRSDIFNYRFNHHNGIPETKK